MLPALATSEAARRKSQMIATVLYLAFILLLTALSSPRRVGDGGEYLAMAMNLAALKRPSLSASDLHLIEKRFQQIGHGYEVVPLEMPALRGSDGRQDLPHFWFYPLLAVPALWIVDTAGAHPNYAFTILNVAIAGAAFLLLARAVSIAVAALVLAGPVIWWIDKAHGDVFTVSLLAMAFALLAKADLKGPPYNGVKGPPYNGVKGPPYSGVKGPPYNGVKGRPGGVKGPPNDGLKNPSDDGVKGPPDDSVKDSPYDRRNENDRGAAFILLGAAAAQNPPLAPVFALVLITVCARHFRHHVATSRTRIPDPGSPATDPRARIPEPGSQRAAFGGPMFTRAAIGLALAALPFLYYELRLGVPTPIVGWTKFHVPPIREIGAFIWDPNIGLIVNDPMIAIAIAFAAFVAWRSERVSAVVGWLPLGCALVLLVGFAQSININHGATPGMNRWTLWLIALSVPLLTAAQPGRRASRTLIAAAIVSTAWSIIWFQPARGENYKTPTRTARWLWTHATIVDNPPAEIFAERVSESEPPSIPTSFAGCKKVLAVDGLWPVPCLPPLDPPASCTTTGTACYANETRSGYRFTAIRFPAGLDFRHARAWPLQPDIARNLRTVLDEIGIEGLAPAAAGQSGAMVRAAHGIPWTYTLQRSDRLFVYIPEADDGARLSVRLPGPMAGSFVDLVSGKRLIGVIRGGAPWTMWDVPVPARRTSLALALKKAD